MQFFDVLFLALLLWVAILYSSVGHGGASGYLALMALFSFDTSIMKGSALLLNTFVSGVSFYHYYRSGFFRMKLFLPFSIGSIPMAYIGGSITIESSLYKKLLAVALLISILRMTGVFGKTGTKMNDSINWLSLLIGMVVGFFSGLIGIGGGIILSPVLLLLRWADIKQTAAVSALFIFVNSLAGLAGQYSTGFAYSPEIYTWIAVAFTGGLIGAYSGSKKIGNRKLMGVLALVLLMASIKLIFT